LNAQFKLCSPKSFDILSTSWIVGDTDTYPTLGRYKLLSELGRGAMGTVFLGLDPRINREVAVKTLPYTEIEANELDDVKTRFFR
jgi:serine/threonine-protein kinase